MTDDPHDSGWGALWAMDPWMRSLLYLAKRQMSDLERQAARLRSTGLFRDGGHIGKFSDPIPFSIPRYETIKPHGYGKSAKLVVVDDPIRDIEPRETDHALMRHYLLSSGDKDFLDVESDRRFMVIGVDHARGPDMTVQYRDEPGLNRTVMRVTATPTQSHPKRYRKPK